MSPEKCSGRNRSFEICGGVGDLGGEEFLGEKQTAYNGHSAVIQKPGLDIGYL